MGNVSKKSHAHAYKPPKYEDILVPIITKNFL